MTKLNHHFTKLSEDPFFSIIERRVSAFREQNPSLPLFDLATSTATRPLAPCIAAALENAVREISHAALFRGDYATLRNAIVKDEYAKLGIQEDEIFISESAKNDVSHIGEIFALENRIAVPDPADPVYVDSNVIAGRTRLSLKTGGFGGVVYLPCTAANQFIPSLPNRPCDLIYLSSPNPITGIAIPKASLEEWVAYAKKNDAILIFDGSYSAYVRSPDCPSSIYEIAGAKEVAIEIRSLAKTIGCMEIQVAYTVIPHALKIAHGYQSISLHSLWKRRQEVKASTVSYPMQKAAAAFYTESGREEVKQILDSYLWQAASLRKNLTDLGWTVFGGIDAPYLWLKTPSALSSWEFFELLLTKGQILTLPGLGFGTGGEGYVRLSTFGSTATMAGSLKRFQEVRSLC